MYVVDIWPLKVLALLPVNPGKSEIGLLFQVIDTREIWCLTLSLEQETSVFCASQKGMVEDEDATLTGKRSASASASWKLKWFSEDSLFNFVALLKAIHAATANPSSPLLVRCVSWKAVVLFLFLWWLMYSFHSFLERLVLIQSFSSLVWVNSFLLSLYA